MSTKGGRIFYAAEHREQERGIVGNDLLARGQGHQLGALLDDFQQRPGCLAPFRDGQCLLMISVSKFLLLSRA
jgi:hypothetical protein